MGIWTVWTIEIDRLNLTSIIIDGIDHTLIDIFDVIDIESDGICDLVIVLVICDIVEGETLWICGSNGNCEKCGRNGVGSDIDIGTG